MSIADNIRQVRATLPEQVKLLCVSKYHTTDEILEAYVAGERMFGESRAQELEKKATTLPQDIEWHFIGHLQRNKAKQVCRYASLIQSVDSWRLLEAIDKAAERCIDVLLEIHIAKEDTKTGLTQEDLQALLEQYSSVKFQHVRIRGLMGMATLTGDEMELKHEFRLLKTLFNDTKQRFFSNDASFDTLSMGMSDDYPIAVAEGSTMVRIGSRIFNTD